MKHTVKVGKVKHDGHNILTTEDGKPIFLGQKNISTEKMLKESNLPYWYPIIPEFTNTETGHAFRYFGYLDLDMKLDDIEEGKAPLFAGQASKAYNKRASIKKKLSNWMQTEGLGKTLEQVGEHVPALLDVLTATRVCMEDLVGNKGLAACAFFTGLKGTRVLWYDESLWRMVDPERSDAGDAGVQLLTEYFSPAAMEALKLVDFDASVYGKGKGLKPDLLPHPVSKIAPAPLFSEDDPTSDEVSRRFQWCTAAQIQREGSEHISYNIRSFWEKVVASVPLSAPELVLPSSDSSSNHRASKKRKATSGRGKKKKELNQKDKNQSKKQLQEEARVTGLMSLAEPHCAIHRIKRTPEVGLFTVVLDTQHRYCHIRGAEHSGSKCYYLVDIIRGTVHQRCHSAKCSDRRELLFPKVPVLTDEDLAYYEHQLTLDDLGRANMFVRALKGNLKVVNAKGDCFIWNEGSTLWEERPAIFGQNLISSVMLPILDSMLQALRDVENEIRAEIAEEGKLKKGKKKKQKTEKSPLEKELKALEQRMDNFVATGKSIMSTRGLSATYSQAKTMLYDGNFERSVNRGYPHLLPVRGGQVVDLRDGSTRARVKEDLFSFECPVEYDGDLAKATPLADTFFLDVMSGNSEQTEYFRCQLGYCLTGEIESRCFFLWWGALGSNAKGTVAKFLKTIMGQFYAQISKEVIVESSRSQTAGAATPHLIPLARARLAMVAETNANDILSEEFVKTWTGNDPLPMRQLYGECFDIVSQAKLVIQSNHKPGNSGEQALRDRGHLMKFGARFTRSGAGPGETKADPELVQRLNEEELIQVFRWILRGCVQWYKHRKIEMPAVVLAETTAYFEENDLVAKWIDACCTAPGKSPRAKAYKSFEKWCTKHTETATGAKVFYASLETKGYSIQSGGKRYILGLNLKNHR